MTESTSLIQRFADRYGVAANKLLGTLKLTAFNQFTAPPDEQLIPFLIVAEQHNLNPFTREIFALKARDGNAIPVVSVDGWAKIINSHPEFRGVEFQYSERSIQLPGLEQEVPEWIECTIHRADRDVATSIREYMAEVYREPTTKTGQDGKSREIRGPWQTHPSRFLRHKSFIQCGRLSFGFAGIFDADEAERIDEATRSTKPKVAMPEEIIEAPPAPLNDSPEPESEVIDERPI